MTINILVQALMVKRPIWSTTGHWFGIESAHAVRKDGQYQTMQWTLDQLLKTWHLHIDAKMESSNTSHRCRVAIITLSSWSWLDLNRKAATSFDHCWSRDGSALAPAVENYLSYVTSYYRQMWYPASVRRNGETKLRSFLWLTHVLPMLSGRQRSVP